MLSTFLIYQGWLIGVLLVSTLLGLSAALFDVSFAVFPLFYFVSNWLQGATSAPKARCQKSFTCFAAAPNTKLIDNETSGARRMQIKCRLAYARYQHWEKPLCLVNQGCPYHLDFSEKFPYK
jgi:hypothetical protein